MGGLESLSLFLKMIIIFGGWLLKRVAVPEMRREAKRVTEGGGEGGEEGSRQESGRVQMRQETMMKRSSHSVL